jgi:hypothetical protein
MLSCFGSLCGPEQRSLPLELSSQLRGGDADVDTVLDESSDTLYEEYSSWSHFETGPANASYSFRPVTNSKVRRQRAVLHQPLRLPILTCRCATLTCAPLRSDVFNLAFCIPPRAQAWHTVQAFRH